MNMEANIGSSEKNMNNKMTRGNNEDKNRNDLMLEQARMLYGTLSKQYPAIMKAKDAAQMLGLREGTVRQWTAKNIIPHKKFNGGSARYVLTELIFWLLSQKN